MVYTKSPPALREGSLYFLTAIALVIPLKKSYNVFISRQSPAATVLSLYRTTNVHIPSVRNIGQSFVNGLKTPDGLAVLFFVLFVLANAAKTAVFNRLLIDAPPLPTAAVPLCGLYNKIVILSVLFLLMTRPKYRFWFAGFYILQQLYMYVNLSYHFNLEGYIHISQYVLLYSEAFDLMKYSAVPHDPRMWYLAVDAPFFLCLLFFYPGFRRISMRYFKPALLSAAIAVFIAVCLWKPPEVSAKQLMSDPYTTVSPVVRNYGLLMFNIVDFFNYRQKREDLIALRYGPEVHAPGSRPPHPSIVMLQVESMGGFIIDHKYRDSYVMPYLHGLSGRCVFFPYMLSYHEAGSTSDCEFSVINSVEPFDNYPSIRLQYYHYPNSMLKQLAKAQYGVFAFHGNRGAFFSRNIAFPKMGFATYFDMEAMGLAEQGWGAPDSAVFSFVSRNIRTEKQPFLYYVITMSSHEPYTLVKSYYSNARFAHEDAVSARNYLNSMSYVDGRIQAFVTDVRAACPECHIFIYGDHAAVIDKNVYRKTTFESDNRLFEFVPLFIITPDSRVYRETACAASFIDVARTVLDVSGVPYRVYTRGQNLLAPPLKNSSVSYRGGVYTRTELYAKIAAEKARH
jgi:lipoteichoic acid synthase